MASARARWSRSPGSLLSLLLNFGLFLAAFRLMTASRVPTRDLWLGVLVAGVLWEILQVLGGYYVGHVVKNSTNTYGTFAFVIALLVWLHLGAQLTLYAAEVNVVVTRRLWPRSLLGAPDRAGRQADADRAGQGRGAPPGGAGRRRVQARAPATGRGAGGAEAQNSRSGDSRRVIATGHEHRPPSAGQPAHSARCGIGRDGELVAGDAGRQPLERLLEIARRPRA